MKNFYIIGSFIIGIIIATQMNGQVSQLNNGPAGPGNYLGWDAASTIPLQIRHNRNDQPIDFFTSGFRRMRIASNTDSEFFTGESTRGFVGIGPNTNMFSRLTISHTTQTPIGGYRTWMQAGVFSYIWTDNMYVGLRRNSNDRSDAIISWSDNATPMERIDQLRFVFTAGPNGGSGTNPRANESIDGYGYMVMTPMPGILNSTNSPVGHIGIGPLFVGNTLPQSRLHINAEDKMEVFTQITNEQTGFGAKDGLRLGYPATGNNNMEAQLIQMENDRLSLYTNGGERLRIMHIGALNNGVNINPGGLASNLTRIAISHNPATPVNRPLSLLHLGYNMNGTGGNTNGWRNWMDLGIYTTNGTDNVYLGLKAESTLLGDRQDAVLNWGDNQTTNGPDNFRFIFTSQTAGGGTAPATGLNGLEGMRLTPTSDAGVRVGIGGDPASNTYVGGSINPTQTLEVNSWGATNVAGGSSGLRFTNLNMTSPTLPNPGNGVLSVNSNGDVIYVESSGSGICEWDESGNDLFMGTPGACHTGNAGIGAVPLANTKLYIDQATFEENPIGVDVVTTGNSVGLNPTNIGVRSTLNSPPNSLSYGFYSEVSAVDKVFGAEFHANVIPSGSSASGIGCSGVATSSGAQIANTGVAGYAASGQSNAGVSGTAIAGESSIGVSGTAYYANTNYGVIASASFGASNFGVFTTAPTNGSNDWALWANGKTHCTSGFWSTSDQNLKENITSIENPSEILSALNPSGYYFRSEEFPQLNLPSGFHYGVMAQELEEVLPGLVTEAVRPAVFDSLGNMISASVNFKTVNYTELIPILIAGFKEQQAQIQSLQEQINGCCSASGEITPSPAGMPLNNNAPDNQQSVTLTNADKAMLGFASPNPNKGEVYVDYYIPESQMGQSEMLFTDAQGRPVQTVRIDNKGNGRLNIDTTNLAAGQYQYTLIVDGEVIATRKMIRE